MMERFEPRETAAVQPAAAETSSSADEHRTVVTTRDQYAVRRFRLRVVDGPSSGLDHTSDAEDVAIGTDPSNQLVLEDSTVSRHHCSIAATEQGFLLRDLGSTNGAFVDGMRAQSVYLRRGSTIAIGETVLRIDILDDEIVERLPTEERYGNLLGGSVAMRRIFAVVDRIASSASTVLLEGETGTGKTLVADMIHQRSARADGPFVVVDCSAIPPTLIESELFGHEKGAFTGAHTARPGAFAAAHGGTVFLDEIGELPLDMQPKLLRALEERVVKPVGSNEPTHLDVRLIAATNRDLREEVNQGSFRSDLYYRLNIVRLRIPPLRERREDIPLLVAHFYDQFSDGDDAPPAELVATLYRRSWPGNVRELRSAVERAVLLDDPRLWEQLTRDDDSDGEPVMTGGFDPALSFRAIKERAVARFERWYVKELVERHLGNLSSAARAARMDRNHLRDLLRRHDVEYQRGPI
jgi:DNA-binding NtrC family response regulator